MAGKIHNATICFFILINCLFLTCGCTKQEAIVIDSQATESQEGIPESAPSSDITVYICGEVCNPGVYELPEGARVCDALECAGGWTKYAKTDYWNLAGRIEDGEMLYFPSVEEFIQEPEKFQSTYIQASKEKDGRVNINRASKEQLMTLPGVGESKADAIILYRETNGAFTDTEQIKNVNGIKDGLYQKIKDLISVN